MRTSRRWVVVSGSMLLVVLGCVVGVEGGTWRGSELGARMDDWD